MLILTRRAGEKIVIGDDIVVTIVESGRDSVRIGIDAPRQVSVHRYEVYAEIARENEAALATDASLSPSPAAPVSAAALPRGARQR
ncbi:MAG: carbon storage regulator CsrA [Ilumatobacter sp.]|uniref:carbon storage regulator CsrA n=1 Tax=Ilumatobacter sp. TaxID=1967498 RepID=UPI00262A2D58|nr:carbon storage regulator CsrA [Ilumatobacter sp.]MDJ0767435.1 carbon storage regulator CsrA [Ilumatobacter sp.]